MRLALFLVIPIALFGQAAIAQCTMGGPNAKTDWSLGYNAGIPVGQMGLHTNTIHSAAFGGYYHLPKSQGRVDVGMEWTFGSYASFTKTQDFGMNGVETPVKVNYNSGVTTGSAVIRYNYFRSNTLSAFVAGKAGYAGFSSRIQIEDPNDPDGCKPLEDNKLISDGTWIVGARAGANVDMQTFFKNIRGQTFLLQAFVGYVQGGNVDYINIKNTSSDDHTSQVHGATMPDDGQPLEVRFVNLQTGTLHEHEVARVFTNPVQFIECGLSFVIRL
jgi:hypothetical protein